MTHWRCKTTLKRELDCGKEARSGKHPPCSWMGLLLNISAICTNEMITAVTTSQMRHDSLLSLRVWVAPGQIVGDGFFFPLTYRKVPLLSDSKCVSCWGRWNTLAVIWRSHCWHKTPLWFSQIDAHWSRLSCVRSLKMLRRASGLALEPCKRWDRSSSP